ncbi:MAG TPA: PASTA domain-containing protein [Candidatus Dormibacteraeota bacterium]|nr:PASTA domain-containing protein [Candidatus Dormibacteraeota bacterium]
MSTEAPRQRFAPGGIDWASWGFPLALAFATGVFVWFGKTIFGFVVPSEAVVIAPELVGLTIADAERTASHTSLRITVAGNEVSDRFPAGVVINQQPVHGKSVRPGRAIAVLVSSGVKLIPMPDLRYDSLRQARLELAGLHLLIAKTYRVKNDQVPADAVVEQKPAPLTSVHAGDEVELGISIGPPPFVKVPNLAGTDLPEALRRAHEAHVQLGQIVWTPFGRTGPPRGRVVRQSPAAGLQIGSDQYVSLQVSAGPGESGYTIRQVHAMVTVPQRDADVEVKMVAHDETGTWTLYDSYARAGQKLDFTLTFVGTATLDTYVDGTLVDQAKV